MCKNPLKQWEVGTEGETYDFGYVQSPKQFIEEVFEIAFGDDAINRDFSYEEVLEELRDNSDRAWAINMDSSDTEMLQEQLRKFSPPQEIDDE